MSKNRLFGTDGVRGIANVELTPHLAFKLGLAYGLLSKKEDESIKFIVGQDTRISGDVLTNSLISGIQSAGISVINVGVIPTPAIPFLIRKYKADGGAMISASHNPFEFNGIKFFNEEGFKLTDEKEDTIQNLIENGFDGYTLCTHDKIGRNIYVTDAAEAYINFIVNTTTTDLTGLKIGLDCGNGATFNLAEPIFNSLGATTHAINVNPDGCNINKNCGSTHLEQLKKLVLENNLDIGFAFDGDGDRCLAVDNKGNVINGDKILAICGTDLQKEGLLKNNTIVGTVLSNMGFKKAMEKLNISVAQTNVGDRYVLEHMLNENLVLGGEESGHIIFLNHNTTGDGLLTAVQLSSVLKKSNKESWELNNIYSNFPQLMVNVNVPNQIKSSIINKEEIQSVIREEENKIRNSGRILVRVSGTEPLIRIMVEGEDNSSIENTASRIQKVIQSNI